MSNNLLPGTFSGRMGAAWSRQYADHRRRHDLARSDHASTSPADTMTPPSRDAMRRSIQACQCPFCEAGPYKNLGLHTHLAHAVGAAELREMSGLEKICSKELSEGSRERLSRRPDREEISKRGGRLSPVGRGEQRGSWREGYEALLAQRHAVMEQRDPIVVERALRGDRLIDIAGDLGITAKGVGDILARHHVTPALTQTNAERRHRLATQRTAARASSEERIAHQRQERLARFAALGGGWTAIGQLAEESNVSEKTMRAYLRKAGADIPDGRTVTHRRPTSRSKQRGRPNTAARAVSDEQMVEIRRLHRTGLTQRELSERFSIGQSTVSRVIRGVYVGESP